MVRGREIGGVVVVSAALCVSCGRRPQLLVVVDTDAPVAAQLATDAGISPEAAIDTVRIDRLDEQWAEACIDDVDCTANFVLPDPSLWPFSFGVATPASGATSLHLRIRAFRGAAATRGQTPIGGATFSTLDPPAEDAIDRLVEIALPASGEQTVRIFLAADCLAVPVSFLGSPHSCIDGSTRAAAPSEGVEVVSSAGGATRAGTWSRARRVPCAGASPAGADAICIPGGFSYIGEADLAGEDEQSEAAAAPPRPIWVEPFWMDRTEVTVGRFRDLVSKGLVTATDDPILPDPNNDQTRECKWLGPADGLDDEYPVNCLSWSLARHACTMRGGDLPSEAQWEHAARGRGQERIYPWGDASPECCTTSAGRGTPECGQDGPEKVGSHPVSPGCGGLGDVSLDGVLDLGGNVGEFCTDTLVAYDQGCWGASGIFVDFHCEDTMTDAHAARGGNWNSGTANARSAFRHSDAKSALYGFRCVYPDGAP